MADVNITINLLQVVNIPAAMPTPFPPLGISSTVDVTFITLNWLDGSNALWIDIEYAATLQTGTFVTNATVAAGVQTFTLSGLAGSTTRYFRLRSRNYTGNSTIVSYSATTSPP